MLKKLIEELSESCGDSIRSGFRKTGIVPLDRQEILNLLPNKGVDANPVRIEENMDESVKDLLRELRYGKEKPRPRTNRKEKLQVEPGRSVKNVGEDEPESEEDMEVSHDSNEEDEEYYMDASEESAKETEVVEPTSEVDYMALNVGNFLVVKLKDQITKKDKLYCSQVSCVSETSSGSNRVIEVSFLKQYRCHKDTFVWPEMKESSVVYPHEVIACLPKPATLCYGCPKFPKKVF